MRLIVLISVKKEYTEDISWICLTIGRCRNTEETTKISCRIQNFGVKND